LQAAKAVFQELGKEVEDVSTESESHPTRNKTVLARSDFMRAVLAAVRRLTDKSAGDVDLQIACRCPSPPPPHP